MQGLQGRPFVLHALGNTASSFGEADFRTHLTGAIDWTAGVADPVYSDCGATVLANYQQIKISAPPNLSEPIGFDQFPDGRIIQTDRRGGVRLHDPATGTTTVLANFADPACRRPSGSTRNEDGMYGPAVDNNFATNQWVYLYYSPQTVKDVKLSAGAIVTQTTPTTKAPTTRPSNTAWDPVGGLLPAVALQVRRGRGGAPAHLDLESEQEILRVPNNRSECCHVAGDIDFDTHNNLWMVTGDDTPAGGVNSGGYGPSTTSGPTRTRRSASPTRPAAPSRSRSAARRRLRSRSTSTAPQIDAALEALSQHGTDTFRPVADRCNTAKST